MARLTVFLLISKIWPLAIYISSDIIRRMKKLCFLGDSLQKIREFSSSVRQNAGYQLDKVQRGLQPDDFKPIPSIGKGVEEIRVWDTSGTYRVIYTARLANIVYVLHCFQKKTQSTPKKDIELAKKRYKAIGDRGAK